MAKNYSLKAQAGYLFSGKLIGLIIRLITPVILVRVFTQEEYGLYRQVLLVCMFFVPILPLGVNKSLFYFYPTAKEKITQLFSQTFFFTLFVGLLFLPLFWFLRSPIANFFGGESFVQFLYPSGLYIFFLLISSILEFVFILEKKSRLVFSYVILDEIARIGFLLITFFIFRTVAAAIWSLACFAMVKAVILFVYLKVKYEISLNIGNWEKGYFFSQVKYAFPLGIGRIVGGIRMKADKFILSALLLPTDFAVYSIANFKIPMINLFYSSVGNVVLPQLTTYRHEGKSDAVIDIWHKMIAKYASVTIPVAIFFFVMADLIVTFLYTDQYAASVNIYRIFLLIFVIQMLERGAILRAYDQTKFIFKASLVGASLGVPLAYLLIKNYGLVGGAVSAVIALYVETGMQLYKSKRLLKLQFSNFLPWKEIGKILFICVASIPVIFSVKYWGFPKPLAILLSGFVYFGFILYFYCKANIFNIEFLKTKVMTWSNNLQKSM